ncbi:hypothetical protein EW146_g1961 [Bondarzewia mesenterica]|uniref:G-alpha-domain-containing protein n=1 Tax=Bondarzewia mesenterica TaxID=1095465 RepID=A0A4S4M293_9AGAM|nr:hypothetical protein EW146_g1961 [Bondarzewia mesenterica]
MGRSFEDDPLTAALAPPPNETPAEKEAREHAEAEAKRVSDEIDEQLKNERIALKKRKPTVKVLLLGQSESGKSTTLKNFQMQYARETWLEERSSWRAVVQLNLVRSINTIVDMLNTATSAASSTSVPTSTSPLAFNERHRLLNLRLAPLRGVQADLERRLGSAAQEPTSSTTEPHEAMPPPPVASRRPQEFYVQSRDGWKSALARFKPWQSDEQGNPAAAQAAVWQQKKDTEVTNVIAECAEDMKAVWEDEVVREMLRRRKVRMEEAPGFFLNDITRIATRDYEPSDDDVVRARLRTLGVQEYSFFIEEVHTAGHEWLMYDVGGTRSSRAHWYPYFDDMDAIIFLAPISCFDERLVEDKRVNRLEDTYMLWRTLCSLRLLTKTQIILFLNKCDLLERKLHAGVQVREHVPSYGDRPNDLADVKKYFQTHFKEIAKQSSPEPRRFYVHLTSVVDTQGTAATLRTVEEGILRDSLRRADLL